MFLGGVSAGGVGDEERHGGLPPHRIPLRLHGDVPVSSGASGAGRPRPPAQVSIRRRPGGGAPRREPRRSGEHLGSDQRGDVPGIGHLFKWKYGAMHESVKDYNCIDILGRL